MSTKCARNRRDIAPYSSCASRGAFVPGPVPATCLSYASAALVGQWIMPSTEKTLSDRNADVLIESQQERCCATDGREWLNERPHETEVVAPPLGPRMIKWGQRA